MSSDYDLPSRDLIGHKAILYVPTDDTEYDLVYVKIDTGQTFENSFSSERWRSVRNAREPAGAERLR